MQAVTAAAAINDVGSWALVSWQATFYQRVYEVGPETYAPALAALLPVGGLLGGVGGGLLADRLSKQGRTSLLTCGASCSFDADVLCCKRLLLSKAAGDSSSDLTGCNCYQCQVLHMKA